MKNQTHLFQDLNSDESATINGGHYYRPCRTYYYPRYRRSSGYSGGSGSGYGSGFAANQTTNVNVLYND